MREYDCGVILNHKINDLIELMDIYGCFLFILFLILP